MNRNALLDIKGVVMAALFAALTAIGAWIIIPIGAIPITLQVLFIYLTGLLLAPRYAALSMVLYLLMGLVGLPVFAGGGSGIAVLIGPMGGYLVAFLLTALCISLLTIPLRANGAEIKRPTAIIWAVGAMVAGSLIIFSLGAGWGKVSTGLPWKEILTGWVLPFLPGDVVKIVVAALIASEVWHRRLLERPSA